jgi:starch phosphorylase
MAKQIIKLICSLGELIASDPAVKGKMCVHFIEDYNVTRMERLLPAADISEQISLAGTEASGTGNMKLMINGAVTLGTMDGANVEIFEQVGNDNILIFGMTSGEVEERRAAGYDPGKLYVQNAEIRQAVDALLTSFGGDTFPNINDMLKKSDYYMTLADFDSYKAIRKRAGELYRDQRLWQKMSLVNIARSGIFCADRSIRDYAENIWGLQK